ncbi:MAG: hypothetical protein ACTSPD_20970 [Promethearchaeota archaeon]
MKRTFLYFLFLFLVIRVSILIIKFNIDEFATAYYFFEAYKNEGIPFYETHRTYYPGHQYFPLFYYHVYLLYYMGGTYLAMKFLWFLFDILCFIYMYKISNEFFIENNLGDNFFELKKRRDICLYLYILCPFLFLLTALRGLGEVITLFFILSSFYYFLKEQYILSYIFLTLGTLYGFFPILLIIPYFLFLINNKKGGVKKIIIFFPIFISIFLLISIPFIINYKSEYFEDLISIIFRSKYSIGFYNVLPEFFNSIIFDFEIFGFQIDISVYLIFQIIVIVISMILFLFFFKINNARQLIAATLYFFLLVPLLSKSFHFRLLFWAIPFFLLFLINEDDFSEIIKEEHKFNFNFKTQLITFIIGNFIILTIFFINVLSDPIFGFSRVSFYIILFIYCIVWGFFLLFLNLLKILILEIWILFYCFFLYFFIFYGYYGIYLLYFLLIYEIICILTFLFIFKNWNLIERDLD